MTQNNDDWRDRCSPGYLAALDAATEARRAQQAALADLLRGRCSQDAYDDARKRLAEAEAAYDAAYAAEQERGEAVADDEPEDGQGDLGL